MREQSIEETIKHASIEEELLEHSKRDEKEVPVGMREEAKHGREEASGAILTRESKAALKIVLRNIEGLKVSRTITPRFKAKPAKIAKLMLPPAKLQSAGVVTPPFISMHKLAGKLRLKILNSLSITSSELILLSFCIRPKSSLQISMRPFLRHQLFESVAPSPFALRTIRITFRRPSIVFAAQTNQLKQGYKLTVKIQAVKQGRTEGRNPQAQLLNTKGVEEPDLEEMPEFFNLFSEGIGELTALDRPVCIILPSEPLHDSFVNSLSIICRELYRIRKGGKPLPRVVSSESKEEAERALKAGGRIFVIDDPTGELISSERFRNSEGINWYLLYDRLRELFSQDYGFVIFHLREEVIEDFRLRLMNVAHVIPKLVIVRFRKLCSVIKKEVAGMCWGFVSCDGMTFDEVFCNAEKAFYDKLESLSRDFWLMHCVKPHAGDPESPEHRLLKALVVKIIAKEMGIAKKSIPEKIPTEYEITSGLTVDIFVRNTGDIIEVETLYGAGFNPIDKIDHETLRRLVNRGINDVKIVLLPLPFFIYLKSLAKLSKMYNQKYGINVEFYTVDVEKERLVSLKETVELLKKLKAKRSNERGWE